MTANKPPMRAGGGGHKYYRALWGEQGEDRQILWGQNPNFPDPPDDKQRLIPYYAIPS